MSKTKARLEIELKQTQEKLRQLENDAIRYSTNCYYAGKYLQALRALGVAFSPIDYDRVLDALEQDKYLD